MTTVEEPPKAEDRPARPMSSRAPRLKAAELSTSRYESVSSMLVALLITLGAAVGVLAIVWLTSRIFVSQTAVPVALAEIGTGDDDELGDGSGLDEPSPEEMQQETDITEPQVEELLDVVEDAVSENPAELSESSEGGAENGGERRRGGGSGKGKGRAQKWEITFLEGNTLDLYAQQLDYFRVELGAIGADSPDVIYAAGLSKPPIQTRTAPRAAEKRLYMSWRPGSPLRDADLKLMAKAGVKDPRRFIVQFYPDDVVGRLQQLEKEFRGRERSQIQRTRFGVRPKAGGGYEFYVLEQIGN